jgi:O-methyltransferase domain
VKFTPEGGRVSLTATVADGAVTIAVGDTGPRWAVPEAFQPQPAVFWNKEAPNPRIPELRGRGGSVRPALGAARVSCACRLRSQRTPEGRRDSCGGDLINLDASTRLSDQLNGRGSRMPTQDTPPPFVLFRMITGYYVSQAIYVAARLGLADLIGDGAGVIEDLADRTHTHAASLRRVLRLLASAGLFTEDHEGRFSLTPIGTCLRSTVPGSLHAAAFVFGGITQRTWGDLLRSVETGEPAFRRVFGMDPFAYLAEHPDESAHFDTAMASFTTQIATAVVSAYDFTQFRRIVDIGGGSGAERVIHTASLISRSRSVATWAPAQAVRWAACCSVWKRM